MCFVCSVCSLRVCVCFHVLFDIGGCVGCYVCVLFVLFVVFLSYVSLVLDVAVFAWTVLLCF